MPKNVEKWLEKAKSELNVDDLAEINHLVHGVRYKTFAHQNLNGEHNFQTSKANNDWTIGLKLINPADHLVTCLFDGAEFISIHLDHDHPLGIMDTVFEKVSLDHIHTEIVLDQSANFEDLPKNLKNHQNVNIFQRSEEIFSINSKKDIIKIDLGKQTHFASALITMAEQIEQNNELKEIRLNITVTKEILFNIGKIRGLKILVTNLLSALNQNKISLQISANIDQDCLAEDNFEQNLIVMSSAAVSAVIAGVDNLLLTPKPANKKSIKELHRLSFNIQHILKHESRLDEVIDPAKGSFFLEDMTQQIVRREWTALVSVLDS